MRLLAFHRCGSTDLEAIETTAAHATWYGVAISDDGVIHPAAQDAVLEYGDTDLVPELHCLGCGHSWRPRRAWDAERPDDERREGY